MKLSYFVAHRAAKPRGLARPAWKYLAAAGLWVLLLSMPAFSQGATPVVSCESLAKLSLPDTTITLAQPVAAGEFKVPPITEIRPANNVPLHGNNSMPLPPPLWTPSPSQLFAG